MREREGQSRLTPPADACATGPRPSEPTATSTTTRPWVERAMSPGARRKHRLRNKYAEATRIRHARGRRELGVERGLAHFPNDDAVDQFCLTATKPWAVIDS